MARISPVSDAIMTPGTPGKRCLVKSLAQETGHLWRPDYSMYTMYVGIQALDCTPCLPSIFCNVDSHLVVGENQNVISRPYCAPADWLAQLHCGIEEKLKGVHN